MDPGPAYANYSGGPTVEGDNYTHQIEDAVAATLFALSGALGAVHTFMIVQRTRRNLGSLCAGDGGCNVGRTGPWLVSTLVTAGFFARCVWFSVKCAQNISTSHDGPQDPTNHPGWRLMSRVAMMLQLTAFSVVLYAWVVTMRELRLRCLVKYSLLVFNFVLYLFSIVAVLFVPASTNDDDPAFKDKSATDHALHVLYDANIFTISVAFFVFGVCMLALGVRVQRKLRRMARSSLVQGHIRQLNRIMAVSIVCFFLRCVVFALPPTVGVNILRQSGIDDVIYPWFYFPIPEILPGLAVIHFTGRTVPADKSRRGQSSAEASLIPPMVAYRGGGGGHAEGERSTSDADYTTSDYTASSYLDDEAPPPAPAPASPSRVYRPMHGVMGAAAQYEQEKQLSRSLKS